MGRSSLYLYNYVEIVNRKIIVAQARQRGII